MSVVALERFMAFSVYFVILKVIFGHYMCTSVVLILLLQLLLQTVYRPVCRQTLRSHLAVTLLWLLWSVTLGVGSFTKSLSATLSSKL